MANGERIEQTRKLLEDAKDAMRSDTEFARQLRMMGRFYRYSRNNQLLIGVQCPDATYVKGYRSWQDLGRQVRRGESGIFILQPRPYTSRDEEDARTRMYFKAIAVFDITQTDAIEGKNAFEPPIRPDVAECPEVAAVLWNSLVDYCAQSSIPVLCDTDHSDAQTLGSFYPTHRTIWIRSTGNFTQMTKTLVHELSHALSYDALASEEGGYDYALGECVAESVAFIVCTEFGIDCELSAAHYVTLWDRDGAFDRATKTIHDTAASILDLLDGALTADRDASEQEGGDDGLEIAA